MVKNNDKKKKVTIYWNDIFVYHDGAIHKPTPAYTEGELIRQNKRFLFLKNPETILFSPRGPKNHPNRKAKWYVIPRVLISSIVYVEKK